MTPIIGAISQTFRYAIDKDKKSLFVFVDDKEIPIDLSSVYGIKSISADIKTKPFVTTVCIKLENEEKRVDASIKSFSFNETEAIRQDVMKMINELYRYAGTPRA